MKERLPIILSSSAFALALLGFTPLGQASTDYVGQTAHRLAVKTGLAAGPRGPRGPRGFRGARGPQGLKGDAGAQGLKGDPGANGANGAAGPQGATGSGGATGAKGATGSAGPTVGAISGPLETPGAGLFATSVGGYGSITLPTAGNVLLIGTFHLAMSCTTGPCSEQYAVRVDNVAAPGSAKTITIGSGQTYDDTATIYGIVTGVSAGTHSFGLMRSGPSGNVGWSPGPAQVVAVLLGS